MAAEETNVTKVRFNFRKSNYFRVIHCDLARSDLSPGGNIAVTVFSDSIGHPSSVVRGLSEDGSLGTEISREGDPDDEIVIDREVEAKIILTPEKAQRIIDSLQQMLQNLEYSEGTNDDE